jgi:hypothetical protein
MLSLIACQPGRGDLNFTTEPTIFRGVWMAQAKSEATTQTSALRLELTATYVNKTTYTVTGTLKFMDDPPLEVSGRASGSGESYLLANASNLFLTLKQGSSDVGGLVCYWSVNFAEKACSLEFSSGSRVGRYSVLNLVKP